MKLLALGLLALTLGVSAAPAAAVIPGANGQIAFSAQRTNHDQVFAMGSDGSNQTNLSNNVFTEYEPAISPDGKKVAYAAFHGVGAGESISLMNADGSDQHVLFPGALYNPTWSPDGTMLAFDTLRDTGHGVNSEIVRRNLDGTGETEITRNTFRDENPAWSPDGSRIAFWSLRGDQIDIYTIKPDGTDERQLTHTTANGELHPAWSPDGNKIVYDRTAPGRTELWTMNADGSGQAPLADSAVSSSKGAWSPDGTKVAFERFTGGQHDHSQIAVIDADGTNEQTYTDTDTNNFAPDWGTTKCPDADGDALCDPWETSGIDVDDDGTVDLELYDDNGDGSISAGEHADPRHKDVYVEADWMEVHQPRAQAIQDVVEAFGAAPVANPDGTTGIRLHVVVDDRLPETNTITLGDCTPAGGESDFDDLKSRFFGTSAERGRPDAVLDAKRLAFRYVIWAHNQVGNTNSGCAELPGNDFMITLGSFTQQNPPFGHRTGSDDEEAGTFMHELGHTFGLRHGGGDDVNCKPNYLSVMNYNLQFAGAPVPGRPLDYSRQRLPTLDEFALNELDGIGGPAGLQTAFGDPARPFPASGPIDWNQNGHADEPVVTVNVNENSRITCDGSGISLEGHDDWPSLIYDFRSSADFADGRHSTAGQVVEQTYEQELANTPGAVGGGGGGGAPTGPPPAGPPPSGSAPAQPRPACTDRVAPRATITRGKKGVRAASRSLVVAGTARDASGCSARSGARVARVQVAVARLSGKRCRFLTARGKAGRTRACGKPVFLTARGTARWTLKISRRPAAGRYEVFVRAIDAAGNKSKVVTRTLRIKG